MELFQMDDRYLHDEEVHVFWDGDKASILDEEGLRDAMDGKDWLSYQIALENDNWSMSTYRIGNIKEEDSAHDGMLQKGDACLIEVRSDLTYDEALLEYGSMSKHENCSTHDMWKPMIEWQKRADVFRGLLDVEGTKMAGYTEIVETAWGTTYVLRYYGLGSMKLIDRNAQVSFHSFGEIRDVEQEKRELGIE